MPLRRVRPLRRAIVGGAVATAAYQGGKRKAQSQATDAETQARLAQVEAQQKAAAPPAPATSAPPPAPAGESDRLDELKKLADLKEMGALSEEEFAREKARILGS